MENQEKTEMKEKKWMKPETETALIAIGLLLISMALAFFLASSDRWSKPGDTWGVILGGTWIGGIWGGISGGGFFISGILGGIWGGILGGIFSGILIGGFFGGILGGGFFGGILGGGFFGGILGGIFGGILGGILIGGFFGGILGGIWNIWSGKKKKKINLLALTAFAVILLLPFCVLVVPLSKYHNYRQLERDQKIVEILELKVLEDEVMILLPENYVGENSYLKKVFSLGWAGEKNKKRWEEIAIPCREEDNYCYEAKLPFSKKKTEVARLELFFGHAYQNYTGTKEVSLKQ